MSEDDLVAEFCTVLNISDKELARSALVDSNWDLNNAIYKHLNERELSLSRQDQNYSIFALLRHYCESLFKFITSWIPFFNSTPFYEYFASTYGNTSIKFYRGDFRQASEFASSTSRPLIVYLHYEKSENTMSFCKDVLCSSQIGEILYGEYIFWGKCVDSSEGRRVKHLCGANNYPHISIFAFEQNNPIMIGKIQGKITMDSFARFAKASLTKVYEGEYGQAKVVKDRMLRERQDRELEEAMREDSKRMVEQRNKEVKQIHEERKNKEFSERFKSRVVPRNDFVKLIIRLPDGSRMQENFLKTDTIGYIQEWLSAIHLIYPEMEDKRIEDFTLQIPYSDNKVFKTTDTLEDVGLSPNGTIVVKLNK